MPYEIKQLNFVKSEIHPHMYHAVLGDYHYIISTLAKKPMWRLKSFQERDSWNPEKDFDSCVAACQAHFESRVQECLMPVELYQDTILEIPVDGISSRLRRITSLASHHSSGGDSPMRALL